LVAGFFGGRCSSSDMASDLSSSSSEIAAAIGQLEFMKTRRTTRGSITRHVVDGLEVCCVMRRGWECGV
jgi:hypothetical protein